MDPKQNFLYTGNRMNAEERNAFVEATPGANSEDIFQAENGMFKDNLGEYRDKNGIKYLPDGIPALTFPNTKGWEQPTHWAHPTGSGLNPEDYPELESSFYEDPETKLRVRKPAAWDLPGAVNVAQVGGGAGVGAGVGTVAGNGTPGAVGPSPLPGQNGTGSSSSGPAQGPQQPGALQDWCGSNGTEWVPDSLLGIDISGSCKKHDQCYGTPNASKQQCDQNFLIDLINDTYGGGILSPAVAAYYAAVKFLGKEAFDKAQNKTKKQP